MRIIRMRSVNFHADILHPYFVEGLCYVLMRTGWLQHPLRKTLHTYKINISLCHFLFGVVRTNVNAFHLDFGKSKKVKRYLRWPISISLWRRLKM